jgi:single-strand DNA-binding protein
MTVLVSMVGNLTKDCKLDDKKATFSIAVNTGYGEAKSTEFFVCTLWGNRGTKLGKYLTKGTKVFISGSFGTFKGTDNNTVLTLNVNEIELVGRPSANNSTGTQQVQPQQAPAPSSDPFDDDIPF